MTSNGNVIQSDQHTGIVSVRSPIRYR